MKVSFVFGKAKLAPLHATTIPRLELCAAVLAVEIAELVIEEQAIKPYCITYYLDSKVVLGYIANETRRFYTYVANRVERIRKSSLPEEWRYVPTHLNPADCATRSVKANELESCAWLSGPKFLRDQDQSNSTLDNQAIPESLTDDPEVRPEIKALNTNAQRSTALGSTRFMKFSSWSRLVRGMSKLIVVARSYVNCKEIDNQTNESAESQPRDSILQSRQKAELVIIKNVQLEAFEKEIGRLKNGKRLSKRSPLSKLNPIIDQDGD